MPLHGGRSCSDSALKFCIRFSAGRRAKDVFVAMLGHGDGQMAARGSRAEVNLCSRCSHKNVSTCMTSEMHFRMLHVCGIAFPNVAYIRNCNTAWGTHAVIAIPRGAPTRYCNTAWGTHAVIAITRGAYIPLLQHRVEHI